MLPYDPDYNRDTPDLGLGYLAACLKKGGDQVDLALRVPLLNSRVNLENLIREGDYDLIGIKVMSCSVLATKETIKLIRGINSSAVIVLGGPQVSGHPMSIFNLIPGADFAFHGEAENGLVSFLKKFSQKATSEEELRAVPNLVWRRGSEITVNPIERVDDLNAIPFPEWELMQPKTFYNTPFGGHSKRFPIAPILLTRGCPNRCTFCEASLINGCGIRSRTVENIISEIDLLREKHAVKEIQFFDSNCAHRLGPLRSLCQELISRKTDVTWSAPNGIRIDSIDQELADLMKRSGCFYVHVGIESGSPRILKQIRKALPLDVVREKVVMLREAGIGVTGYFMIGFPGETLAEIKQTISLAMELPLTGASFAIFCPLPGTDIYSEIYGDQEISIDTLNSLDFRTYQNDLSEVTHDRLRSMQKNAYSNFHLRPRIIANFIRNLNSPSKIRFVWDIFYAHAFKG